MLPVKTSASSLDQYMYTSVILYTRGTMQHMHIEGGWGSHNHTNNRFTLCKGKLLRLSGSTCEVLVDECCETIASWLKTPWCTLDCSSTTAGRQGKPTRSVYTVALRSSTVQLAPIS